MSVMNSNPLTACSPPPDSGGDVTGVRHGAGEPRSHEQLLQAYVQPIFGFALNRTGSRAEAEDLAQEIMLEALLALRKQPDIRNLDAYIWTIARYRWAHWAKRRVHAPRTIEINGMSDALVLDEPTADELLVQAEAAASLRRELAYLSDLHRRIVVLHYYEGMKQADIARRLNLPVGTVKWHLHDARKELKRRMNDPQQAPLAVNPVKLRIWGHSGSPGNKGETSDFLGRPLAQNIVYAAYPQPRTVHEIGEAIGVPPALLEEEVR